MLFIAKIKKIYIYGEITRYSETQDREIGIKCNKICDSVY